MHPYEPITHHLFSTSFICTAVSAIQQRYIYERLKLTSALVESMWIVTELTCSLVCCRLLCSSSISLPFSLWVFNHSSVLFFNSSVNHSTRFSNSSFSCSISLWRCYSATAWYTWNIKSKSTLVLFWVIVKSNVYKDFSAILKAWPRNVLQGRQSWESGNS